MALIHLLWCIEKVLDVSNRLGGGFGKSDIGSIIVGALQIFATMALLCFVVPLFLLRCVVPRKWRL